VSDGQVLALVAAAVLRLVIMVASLITEILAGP